MQSTRALVIDNYSSKCMYFGEKPMSPKWLGKRYTKSSRWFSYKEVQHLSKSAHKGRILTYISNWWCAQPSQRILGVKISVWKLRFISPFYMWSFNETIPRRFQGYHLLKMRSYVYAIHMVRLDHQLTVKCSWGDLIILLPRGSGSSTALGMTGDVVLNIVMLSRVMLEKSSPVVSVESHIGRNTQYPVSWSIGLQWHNICIWWL